MTDVFSRGAKGPGKTLLDKLHYVRPMRLPVVMIRHNINHIFCLVGTLNFTVCVFLLFRKIKEEPQPSPYTLPSRQGFASSVWWPHCMLLLLDDGNTLNVCPKFNKRRIRLRITCVWCTTAVINKRDMMTRKQFIFLLCRLNFSAMKQNHYGGWKKYSFRQCFS